MLKARVTIVIIQKVNAHCNINIFVHTFFPSLKEINAQDSNINADWKWKVRIIKEKKRFIELVKWRESKCWNHKEADSMVIWYTHYSHVAFDSRIVFGAWASKLKSVEIASNHVKCPLQVPSKLMTESISNGVLLKWWQN